MIEPTEAMTVIDVNSGSAAISRKSRKNLLWQVNREAAGEIAVQLRLRNISGIIVVDFINMDDDPAKEAKLLDHLKDVCSGDRKQVNVIDYTALGLAELTRRKTLSSLEEQIRSAGFDKDTLFFVDSDR